MDVNGRAWASTDASSLNPLDTRAMPPKTHRGVPFEVASPTCNVFSVRTNVTPPGTQWAFFEACLGCPMVCWVLSTFLLPLFVPLCLCGSRTYARADQVASHGANDDEKGTSQILRREFAGDRLRKCPEPLDRVKPGGSTTFSIAGRVDADLP